MIQLYMNPPLSDSPREDGKQAKVIDLLYPDANCEDFGMLFCNFYKNINLTEKMLFFRKNSDSVFYDVNL